VTPADLTRALRRRAGERVWCTVGGPPAHDFDEVAVAAGLRPLGEHWIEVRAHRAEQVVTALLSRGLAYGERRMPDDRARSLAHELVHSCGSAGTRYATNAKVQPDGRVGTWTGATDHTIDAGLVVVGASSSSCFWVADED
jgi:hypothetical protein